MSYGALPLRAHLSARQAGASLAHVSRPAVIFDALQHNAWALGGHSKIGIILDRTSLNLVSIILGGAGLFSALTGLNVPQRRMSYFGENPYLIKHDALSGVMLWLFTGLALLGLGVQVAAEIAGDAIPQRSYTMASYVRVTVVTVLVTCGIVWALTRAGRVVARRIWQPKVLDGHLTMIRRARFALDHGGYLEEHLAELDRFTDEQNEATLEMDLKQVDLDLSQLESLLELPPLQDRQDRLHRLERYY